LPNYIADIGQIVVDDLRVEHIDKRVIAFRHDVLADEDVSAKRDQDG
jgi:hypothetical protein